MAGATMACEHKFKKYLNLEKLDFEPTTLIVGTFNPLIDGNKAEWFYGRSENNFWEILPKLYGVKSLISSTPVEWKLFCKENKIAITDLISSIDDADMDNPEHLSKLKTYSDKSIAEAFKRHNTIKIADLLQKYPSIKNIYFTRGVSPTFWKRLWQPIEKYTSENKLHEAKLITPSRYAFYQQSKHNKQNPLDSLSLQDYILKDWKSKWHK